MNTLAEQIERHLAALRGLPMWASHRAADLQGFQFGARHTVPARRGGTKEVGDFALHVQCAWRISGPAGVIVASRDRYDPPDGVEHTEDFDWDIQGGNRGDARMAAFLAEHSSCRVTASHADRSGGFTLSLEQDFALEVFPDDSSEDERWRLFRPSKNDTHLVLAGQTLEGAGQ